MIEKKFYAISIDTEQDAKKAYEVLKDEPMWLTTRYRLKMGLVSQSYPYISFEEDQWTGTPNFDEGGEKKTVIKIEEYEKEK